MLRYILKRLLLMVPVLIGVSILAFAVQVFTPGDPATVVLGTEASEETIAAWNAKYDLDKPVIYQYGKFMLNLLTKGDFGMSFRTGTSINKELASRWPISLGLSLISCLIATAIGVPLGIISAKHRSTFIDSFARIFGIVGISIPMFWLAFLMMMLFCINLKWLPVSGLYSWKHWVIPALAIGIVSSASILRITRSSVLDSISSDYVRTARAKGQTEKVIMRHHILRNSLIPMTNTIGSQFSSAFGGSAVIETVFVIVGMGSTIVAAINNRDYALLRACVLIVAFFVSMVNLLVDVIYALIDPRVKARFSGPKRGKKKEIKKEDAVNA